MQHALAHEGDASAHSHASTRYGQCQRCVRDGMPIAANEIPQGFGLLGVRTLQQQCSIVKRSGMFRMSWPSGILG